MIQVRPSLIIRLVATALLLCGSAATPAAPTQVAALPPTAPATVAPGITSAPTLPLPTETSVATRSVPLSATPRAPAAEPPTVEAVAPTAAPAPALQAAAVTTAAPAAGAGGGAGPSPVNATPEPVSGALAAPSLKDELFLVTGLGGGGGDCSALTATDGSVQLMGMWGYETLAFGLTAGEEVAYEVYDAAGSLVTTGTAAVVALEGGSTALGFDLVTKAFAPGEWRITLDGPSTTETRTFVVDSADTDPYIEMSLKPDPDVESQGRSLMELQAGDRVLVDATYLPPDSPVALGFYQVLSDNSDREAVRLRDRTTMQGDSLGRASMSFQIPADLPAGSYCLILVAHEGYDPEQEPAASVKGAYACMGLK